MNTKLLDRFLEYVKIHTTSDPASEKVPSTGVQSDFLLHLQKQLEGVVGIKTEYHPHHLIVRVPANTEDKKTKLAFFAHVDTAPDACGNEVKPKVWENYQGQELPLNDQKTLSPQQFPSLLKYQGQTLISTSGDTLLGADDKAGVAILMESIFYFVEHPAVLHGDLVFVFTTDEEIGRGAKAINIQNLNADFGYTLDGGELGELEYQNFNAAKAKISFLGQNIHPGYAKDKMINAIHYALRFSEELPEEEVPENTEFYEGFFHLHQIEGDVSKASLHYLIREFDQEHFETRKELIRDLVESYRSILGEKNVILELEDQYYNMEAVLTKHPQAIELAKKAMEKLKIPVKIKAIRGGTDGAHFSHAGLPCPNLFTGMQNIHCEYEYVCLEVMEKAMELVVEIVHCSGEN